MPLFADLLQQGTAHAWLFIPTAMLLGALHGLEPGHSKTMMAAFIIAIGGTIGQAVLLGMSAAISHTAIVWAVALGGLHLGRDLNAEAVEPYLQLASAVIVVGVAAWMVWRTRRDQLLERAEHDHGHDQHGHHHHHHAHDHTHGPVRGLGVAGGFMDAHELAHADDIRRRFGGRSVTTWQIALFGLTGGLIPCPAAVTVLLVCLQLKQLSLGVVLVGFFSLGLAVTMVSVGVIAALGVRHVQSRWAGFGALARRAPYASAVLMMLVAVYMAASGWVGLAGAHPPG